MDRAHSSISTLGLDIFSQDNTLELITGSHNGASMTLLVPVALGELPGDQNL